MMASRFDWWMLAFIPTIVGTFIMITFISSGAAPILGGYLKLISLSTMLQNFVKNSMEFLKFLVGPGG
ncbi:MAG: hypothetical protein DRN81_06125 [Thermoproteota archaeon]|nr:MAG: hypothetical protein DRN81_06125 [Candidatus Korarchaeota archaeon]